MDIQYSYDWFIRSFRQTKESAEQFILTTEESQFLQSPGPDQWSAAECYSHLIKFGQLYLQNMTAAIEENEQTTANINQPFQPRWIAQKAISFFEPPYNLKVNTLKSMKPEAQADYNRIEVLDKYMNLQDRFISQLKKGKKQKTDLQDVKIEHPVFGIIKMTLSESFAITEVHQRRHHWQAKQTVAAIKENNR